MTYVPAGKLIPNQVPIWDGELKNELTSSPTKVSQPIAYQQCINLHAQSPDAAAESLRMKFWLQIQHN